MRLGAQRSKGHSGRDKTLADRGDAFDLFNRNRLAQRLDREQITQVDRRVGLHGFRKLLPQRIGRIVTCSLQHMHCLRLPRMLFAGPAGFVETTNWQHVRATFPAFGVDLFQLGLNTVRSNARNATVHTGEIFGNHSAGQAHGFKVQTTAIGRQHGNPHLGHDFQQTCINRSAITVHRLGQCPINKAAPQTIRDGILRQIGVNGCGSTADQHGEIMRINAFCCTHVDRTEGP